MMKDHVSISPTFYTQLYVRKLGAQLFCGYILGFYFTSVSLPVQKLRVECWWNWPLVCTLVSSFNLLAVGEITLWCRRLRCKNITWLQARLFPLNPIVDWESVIVKSPCQGFATFGLIKRQIQSIFVTVFSVLLWIRGKKKLQRKVITIQVNRKK